jgi:hypothetical protein
MLLACGSRVRGVRLFDRRKRFGGPRAVQVPVSAFSDIIWHN